MRMSESTDPTDPTESTEALSMPSVDVSSPDVINAMRRDRLRAELFEAAPKERRIGHFMVRRTLGRGGMGTVLEADDTTLDRAVALKLLRPKLAARHGARLLREARLLAKISHPNVVLVHEAGEADGRLFIAMELVRGQTLRQWQQTRRTWRDCLAAYQQAGRGLAAAHAHGIVHRDFKPSNCMIDADGRVRVLDFGLAQDEREGVERVAGTLAYMAPEQLAGMAVDARSDQFSLCVALFEAIHGVHPFERATAADTQAAIMAGELPAVPRRGVPRWLARVLRRGLSHDPAARWPDLESLLHALQPRRWGRTAGLALSVAGVVVAAWWMGSADAPLLCAGASANAAEVWNETRRETARAGLAATGVALAEVSWPPVEQTVDAYVQQWIDAQTEVCRATQVLGEQSPALMDRRMACLDQRLHALSSMLDTLERADVVTVIHAVDAALRLPEIGACTRIELEPEPEPLEALPLRRQLIAAQAERNAGHLERAQGELESIRAQAEQQGLAALAVEVLWRRGQVEHDRGLAEDADATLEAAMWQALRVGNDRVAFEAAIAHGEVLGMLHVDAARALPGLEHAEALLHHAGNSEADQLTYLTVAGMVLGRHGRYEPAKTKLAAAEALARRLHGTHHVLYAEVLNARGVLAETTNQLEEAERLFEQLLALDAELYGPTHLAMASVLNNLAVVLGRMGRWDRAREQLERALEIRRAALGEHPLVADTLMNLGGIAFHEQRLEDAVRETTAAQRIYAAQLGEHAPKTLDAELAHGMALASLGRAEEAERMYRSVLARQTEALGERHPDRRRPLIALGKLLMSRGRAAEAVEPLRLAYELEREAVEAAGLDPATSDELAQLEQQLDRAKELVELP
jgi:tetratricopeptide (TPR) repeat protein